MCGLGDIGTPNRGINNYFVNTTLDWWPSSARVAMVPFANLAAVQKLQLGENNEKDHHSRLDGRDRDDS